MFVSFGSRWDLNFCMLQELMERRGEIWSHFEAMPFTFKDAPRADGAKRRILDSFFFWIPIGMYVCFLWIPLGFKFLYAPRADGAKRR